MELSFCMQAIVTGMSACGIYRCVLQLRKIWAHKRWTIALEDSVYWVTIFAYLFSNIYYTNNGKIRWYYILGVVVGAMLSSEIQKKYKKVHKKFLCFFEKKGEISLDLKKNNRYY